MIAIMLIAGLTLLVAICVADLIAPSCTTATIEQPWQNAWLLDRDLTVHPRLTDALAAQRHGPRQTS